MGDQRVALVTGGSRGIGASICQRLARDGFYVFVNYRGSREKAEEVANICQDHGGGETIQFDVSDPVSVEEGIKTILEKKARIDVLVNNAGIAIDNLIVRLKENEWERVIRTNLSGAFYCCKAVARSMIKNRYGRIINIGSVTAEMGNAGQSAYCSAKAGLLGLTRSLAKELGPRNITVNCITPGFIDTDMTKEISEEAREKFIENLPIKRFGVPEDVAHAVSFLADERSSYITGEVLRVNGGLYM